MPAGAGRRCALSGCVVGPDFKPPDAPTVPDPARTYSATPLPAQAAGSRRRRRGATPGLGQDVPAL
ncbi:MAG: hypothetical protein M9915_02980 [Rhizobacter sp.]|nr:hypothetical protein [Rhizobacter sp.]